MPRKLTDEQKAEMKRRYQAGEPVKAIVQAFHAAPKTVCAVLREAGILRTGSEAQYARYSRAPVGDLQAVSAAAWRELYEIGEQPSMAELARRLGVHCETIGKYLRSNGITPRSNIEQHRIDFARERRPTPPPFTRAQLSANGREVGRRPEHTTFMRAIQRRGVRVSAYRRRNAKLIPCCWCGTEVLRWKCQWEKAGGRACCGYSCSAKASRAHCSGKPLPFLTERLKELATEQNARDWASIERLAVTIGAREPEIEAVLLGNR